MPEIDVSGRRVPYQVAGTGPGLLLLHGTGATAETNYGHLLDHVAGHTAILPDYMGAALGPDDDIDELTLDLVVEEVVAAVRDADTGGPVDVVGFSLGAVVAALVAARHPELVRKLVLVAGWAKTDPRHSLAFSLWRKLADLDSAAYAEYITLLLFTPPTLAGMGSEGLAEAVAGTAFTKATLRQIELGIDLDVRDEVATITAPTLVIGCTRDQLVPVENSQMLHELIPGSGYAEVEAAHLVMFEKADELMKLVTDFLN